MGKRTNKGSETMRIVAIVITLIVIGVSGKLFNYDNGIAEGDEQPTYAATVLSVDDSEVIPNEYIPEQPTKNIYFTAQFRSSGADFKGVQYIDELNKEFIKEVQAGDKIIVILNENLDRTDTPYHKWALSSFDRIGALMQICCLFLLLVVLIGRTKGIDTVISLFLTVLLIFFVFIPAILCEVSIYAVTAFVSTIIILMSLIVINGGNSKTYCAILGNLAGVIVTAILGYIAIEKLKISGLIDNNYRFLGYMGTPHFNLRGIAWAGMVIGSLGAVMDVSMTIASAMNELSEHMENKTFSKMFRSGMNIGKDAIGTMTNTLILAYTGSSLALILIFATGTNDIIGLFSLEIVAVEIVQAVVGSMGILLAVPLTTLASSYVYTRKTPKASKPGGEMTCSALARDVLLGKVGIDEYVVSDPIDILRSESDQCSTEKDMETEVVD